MEERYNALLAGTGQKDRAVDFADLGVDALFIDESHEFKNLAFQTTMNVSGLGNISGSAKRSTCSSSAAICNARTTGVVCTS